MNTNSTTTHFNTEIGLYIAFLTGQKMKAKFKPKSLDEHPSKLHDVGKNLILEWNYAYTANEIEYYETNDIRFPSTDAFPITDLHEAK